MVLVLSATGITHAGCTPQSGSLHRKSLKGLQHNATSSEFCFQRSLWQLRDGVRKRAEGATRTDIREVGTFVQRTDGQDGE